MSEIEKNDDFSQWYQRYGDIYPNISEHDQHCLFMAGRIFEHDKMLALKEQWQREAFEAACNKWVASGDADFEDWQRSLEK